MKLSSRPLLTLLLTAFLFSACEREISFENGGVPPPVPGGGGSSSGTSIFSFAGGAGNCTGALVNGTYTAGVAVASSNTVVISVLVDSVGTYAITTNTLNGVSFSGSGNFTSTGAQSITLTGTGTPTTAGSYNYTPGGNGCIFSITVAAGSGGGVTGDFRAKIEGTQWVADKFAQGARMNGLINLTGVGLDKKSITITLADSGVHQYTLAWDNSSNSAGAFTDSALADVSAFTSNSAQSPTEGGGTVNITSIDEVNKTMTGTFSFKGKRHTDGTYRNITEGSFTNLSYITSLTGNTSNSMSVKVGGALFTPTVVTGLVAFGTLTITGTTSSADRTVSINFPPNITPGTYALGGLLSTHYGTYNPNDDPLQATVSDSGSLEIIEINSSTRRVKGRFSFVSSPLFGGTSITLSEGVFDSSY